MQMAKENKIYSGDEVKRYLGVLSEQHHEDMKVIKEGFAAINQRLDGHDEKLDSHTEMIGKLMVDMTTVKGDIETMKEDISVIKGDLKKKVDVDEFRSLERRVLLLERRRS